MDGVGWNRIGKKKDEWIDGQMGTYHNYRIFCL